MLRSPLAWVGGKSRLRARILETIPEHDCYVELFAGAAWVLLGKKPESSTSEVLNDLDGELINFWRVLKHRPAEFSEAVSWLLPSRELWEGWRALPGVDSEIYRAVQFYAVIKLGFGAQRVPTAFGSGNGRNCRRPTTNWSETRDEARAIVRRLGQVWIEHSSWKDCLARFDAPATFFYVDPPYRCDSSKAYAYGLSDDDHRALAAGLLAAKGKWLLSYNDDPFLRSLYEPGGDRVKIERVEVRYTLSRTKRRQHGELLISNY